MQPKISVIIPAFNAEKTIEKCVYSVQKQIYSVLEIIVVNDGSTDNTERVVERLAKNDNRIKLYTINNRGVSHARNYGIDRATGKYITFIDSDDYIDDDMYYKMMRYFEDSDIKIVHCSYKNVNETGKIISVVGGKDKEYFQEHDEAVTCLIKGSLFAGGTWNKIYDISLFDGLRFDESIKYNEDVLINFQLFDKAEKSVYIDSPFYNYVAYDNSSTHSANGLDFQKQSLYVSRQIYQLSKGTTYESAAYRRVVIGVLGIYGAYLSYNDKSLNYEKKQVWNAIKKYKKEGCYKGKKEIIIFYIYKFIPFMYKSLFKVYDKIRVKKLDPEQ